MKAYKIEAEIDCEADHGSTVWNWFKQPAPGVSVLDIFYASKDEAQTMAETWYLGPDVDGIGVSWKISEIEM